MKKIFCLLLLLCAFGFSKAQNEGRIGIFAGVNNTKLNNADDKTQGDVLPTFKPTIGLTAGYHFTVAKKLPLGFSAQFAYNQAGQNYRGYFADTTNYWAFTRLNYYRMGLGFHIGTNPRRMVSLTWTNGITLGLLRSYNERAEYYSRTNDRVVFELNNTTATLSNDTLYMKGTTSAPMYNKNDKTYFTSLDLDFLVHKQLVFGVSFRYDLGLNQVENTKDTFISIYYATEPTTSVVKVPTNGTYKYRAPTSPTEKRGKTNNVFMGVFFSLKYRIYNEDKHRMYYKEHRHDWF